MNHALFDRLVLQGFEPGDCNPEEWAVRRVERLQALLDCEGRLLAPEGWECSRRGGLHGWEKGGARVYRAEQTWWSNDRAMTLRGPFRYALLAIEAAEEST